jgi:hypothetical protein
MLYIKNSMKKKFAMPTENEIHQQKYANEILERFDMIVTQCVVPRCSLSKDLSGKKIEVTTNYIQMVGCQI